MTDTDAISRELEELIYTGLADYDNQRARSKAKANRVLGMSDLGGCREFMRAVIAGDPMEPETGLKWPAFVGTAVGDLVEKALSITRGAVTQKWVTVTLESGIEASGSTDALVLKNRLVDFKTKDGLDEVVDEGPTYQQWVQVSGYLVGLVQAGEMGEDSTASIVFLDRSGGQARPVVFTITYRQALSYLADADERLMDVANALAKQAATGTSGAVEHLKDKPESWCFHVGCPFYTQCWGGEEYQPTGVIDNPDALAAMDKYLRGKALSDKGEALKKQAKTELGAYLPEGDPRVIEGRSATHTLKFTLFEGARYISRRIDLRPITREPKRAKSLKELGE